jgi:hypothetical protein
MPAPLRLSLQVFAQDPAGAPAGTALVRQIWKGGATDRTTRTMIADPPCWLALADHTATSPDPAIAVSAKPLLSWGLQQLVPGAAASPNGAGGVVLVSMDVEPTREDEFNDWYDTEHIPHLSRVPGVIMARRFRALRGSPRYVALYHVEDTDIYATRAWTAANETPWMLRMRRFQFNRTYFMFRTLISQR